MGNAPSIESPGGALELSAGEQAATDLLYLRQDGTKRYTGSQGPAVASAGALDLGYADADHRRVFTRFIAPGISQVLVLEDATGNDVITIADAGDITIAPTGDIILNPAGLQVQVPDDVQFTLGSSNDTVFEHDTAQTNDHLVIGVSNSANLQTILITRIQRIGSDFALDSDIPTLVIHDGSATLTKVGLLRHDGNRFQVVGSNFGLELRASAGAVSARIGTSLIHWNPNNANIDFRIDGDLNDNILTVDAGLERVGIGIALGAHLAKFHLIGDQIIEGVLKIKEQADADADLAGYGQLWINTATPNELFFTDDAGTDFEIGGAWKDWTPVFTGFEATLDPVVTAAKYHVVGKKCTARLFTGNGTSNATTFTVTLPVAATSNSKQHLACSVVTDNGVSQAHGGLMITRLGSVVADVYLDGASGGWTAGGSKKVQFVVSYEIN